jgi:hypothetical protein
MPQSSMVPCQCLKHVAEVSCLWYGSHLPLRWAHEKPGLMG